MSELGNLPRSMISVRGAVDPEGQAHFEQLCELQPQLKDLLLELQEVKDDGTGESFCANALWYGYAHEDIEKGYKKRMSRLVGFLISDAAAPALRTSAAYEVAYKVLRAQLPDCRNCMCD